MYSLQLFYPENCVSARWYFVSSCLCVSLLVTSQNVCNKWQKCVSILLAFSWLFWLNLLLLLCQVTHFCVWLLLYLCQVTSGIVSDPVIAAVQASASVHPGWDRCCSWPVSYSEHRPDAQNPFPSLTGTALASLLPTDLYILWLDVSLANRIAAKVVTLKER